MKNESGQRRATLSGPRSDLIYYYIARRCNSIDCRSCDWRLWWRIQHWSLTVCAKNFFPSSRWEKCYILLKTHDSLRRDWWKFGELFTPQREGKRKQPPPVKWFSFPPFFSLFLSVDDTIKGNHPFVCWLSHQVSIIFSYPTGDDTFSLTDLSQSPLHVWRVCCLLSLSLPCRVWRKSKRKFTSCYYYDSQQQQQQKIRRAVILPRSSSSSSRRRNNMIPNGNCDEQVAPESIRAHSNEGGSQSAITHTTVAERNPKNKRSHWWMYMCESSYIFKGCGEESAKWRCTQTPKEEEELEESSSSCTTTTVKGELYPPPLFFSLLNIWQGNYH